jgi:cytochrome c biogenesis protein
VVLNITSQKTGKTYTQNARVNQPIQLPENLGTFVLDEFRQSADFKGHNIGEAFIGTLTPPGAAPVKVILPVRFPSFDKMRKGDVVIEVADYVPRYYTGLQVVKDPGVWVVYSGFILMIIGCYITFFMSHQQIYLELSSDGRVTRVAVAGTANKNKMGMQTRIDRLATELSRMMPAA